MSNFVSTFLRDFCALVEAVPVGYILADEHFL